MSKGSPEILYTENDPRNLSHESEDLEDTAFFRFSSSADDLIVSPLGNYGSSPLRAMSSNSLYGEDIVNSGGHAFLNSDDLVSPSEFSEAGVENASTPPSRATNMSLSPPPLHGETMSYSSKANSRSRPPRIPANTARSTGGGTHPPKQQPHSTSISHQQQSLLTTHVRGNSHVRGGSIGDASMMSALTDGSFEPELPRHLPQPVSHNAANRSPTSMNIEVRSSTVDPTLTSVPPALQQPVLSDLEERTPPASLKVFPSPKSSTPYSGSHRIPSSPLVPDSLSPIQNEAVSLIAEAMKEQASHSNEIRLAFTTSDHVAKEPEQLNVSALRRLSSLLELLENENGLVSPKTLKRTFEFLMKVPQNAKRNRPIPSRWFFLEIGPVIVYVVFLLSDYLSQYLSYYMNTTARYAFIFLGVSILLRRLLSSAIRTFQTRRLLPSLNEAIEDLLFLIELEYFHRFISTSHDDSRTSSTVRTSQWRASGYVSGQNSDGSADESLVHDTKSVDLKMLRQHFEFGNDCRPVLVKALARIVTSDENCEKRRKSIELLFDYLVGRKGAMDVSLSHMLTVNAAFTTFSETQMRTIVRRLFGSPKRLQKEHFCSMVECRLRQVSVLIRTLDCDNYVQSSIVRAYELLAILSVIGGMISQYNLILSPILSIFVGVLLTALLLYVDNIEGVVFLLFRRSFDVGDRVRLLSSTNDKMDGTWLVTNISICSVQLRHCDDQREVILSPVEVSKFVVESFPAKQRAVAVLKPKFRLNESPEKLDLYRRTMELYIHHRPEQWRFLLSGGRRVCEEDPDSTEYVLRVMHVRSWQEEVFVSDSIADLVAFGLEIEFQLGIRSSGEDITQPKVERRRSSFYRISDTISQDTQEEDFAHSARLNVRKLS